MSVLFEVKFFNSFWQKILSGLMLTFILHWFHQQLFHILYEAVCLPKVCSVESVLRKRSKKKRSSHHSSIHTCYWTQRSDEGVKSHIDWRKWRRFLQEVLKLSCILCYTSVGKKWSILSVLRAFGMLLLFDKSSALVPLSVKSPHSYTRRNVQNAETSSNNT